MVHRLKGESVESYKRLVRENEMRQQGDVCISLESGKTVVLQNIHFLLGWGWRQDTTNL